MNVPVRAVVVFAALVPLLHGAPQSPDQAILDPIPQGPIASGLGLTVEEFASFPKSEPQPTPTDKRLVRWARINDIAATFAPGFFSGGGLGHGFAFVAFHPELKTNGKFYTVHTETGDAIAAKKTDLPPQPNTVYHGWRPRYTKPPVTAWPLSELHGRSGGGLWVYCATG